MDPVTLDPVVKAVSFLAGLVSGWMLFSWLKVRGE